ncbi:MAG: MCP four helix bundle domain-containing protein [Lachnospiraceae bacterium]|nr:MCP four helix bundle domain-containing protein [Lachnospiraceae bacterium]
MLLKKKISIGFVILGFILLLSSLIAVFEFITMRRTVGRVVTEDILSINTTRRLLDMADQYNFELLSTMGDSTYTDVNTMPTIGEDDKFMDVLYSIRNNFKTASEREMADSIRYAYVVYAHVLDEAKDVWNEPRYQMKKDWYFQRLYPVYTKLRRYIKELNLSSQKALKTNSDELSEGFYRSLMPCVVAVGIGILLLFLFNYYLNFYFFNPMVKINRALHNYKLTHKTYDVNVDSGDEVEDLNESIKDLLREHKQLTKNQQQ